MRQLSEYLNSLVFAAVIDAVDFKFSARRQWKYFWWKNLFEYHNCRQQFLAMDSGLINFENIFIIDRLLKANSDKVSHKVGTCVGIKCQDMWRPTWYVLKIVGIIEVFSPKWQKGSAFHYLTDMLHRYHWMTFFKHSIDWELMIIWQERRRQFEGTSTAAKPGFWKVLQFFPVTLADLRTLWQEITC